MAARLFGLKIFGASKGSTAERVWSADRPLDIPHARDLLDFSYPPQSSFSGTVLQRDSEELTEP